MKFREISLKDAFIIQPEEISDERGFFARSYCFKEYQEHGLNTKIAQCNISFTSRKGTLRGMHYQAAPYQEEKLVRCTRGAIYDVIIDLRPDSQTYLKHYGIQLDALNRLMLYVPKGFAHGFITLKNKTEVFYQMSDFYMPESARGYRWNDPSFNIVWPIEVQVISERDRSYADYK